jgi:stress-induced morphogen
MQQLLADFDATHLEVTDFSDDHCEGAKLNVIVVSARFETVSLLQRQRMVNASLADLMPRIHAITMKTWTPEQYESKK